MSQVNAQLRFVDGSAGKQGLDRFKHDLMLRVAERARAEGSDEILPQIASDRLIAKRAKRLAFGCEFCFLVHYNAVGGIPLP